MGPTETSDETGRRISGGSCTSNLPAKILGVIDLMLNLNIQRYRYILHVLVSEHYIDGRWSRPLVG